MVEKDFWVVLFLDLLFNKSTIGEHFAFKGGTSLSKAYHKIFRFSEDLDLVLDWTVLGYAPDEPWKSRSKNQQNKFNTEANERAKKYIADIVLPELKRVINVEGIPDISLTIHEKEPETIEIAYPRLYANQYSLQTIRLEIGPLAAWTPVANKIIQSYVAEAFPQLFKTSEIIIPTVEAKRTFWEKVVILHREANRGKSSITYRYSRHYYDVHMLGLTEVKEEAFSDLALLKDVVAFNQKFYPVKAAKFDEAVPSTLRLIPVSEEQIKSLEQDYQDMSEMFFDIPVPFKEIIDGLRTLEDEIHTLKN